MTPRPLFGLLASMLVLPAGQAVAQSVLRVPLMELILFPERYEREVRVEVVGFLDREAGLRLFVSRDLAEENDFASSIVVGDGPSGEITFSTCAGYVRIRGSARTFPEGVSLGKIERIEVAGTDGVCWQKSKE